MDKTVRVVRLNQFSSASKSIWQTKAFADVDYNGLIVTGYRVTVNTQTGKTFVAPKSHLDKKSNKYFDDVLYSDKSVKDAIEKAILDAYLTEASSPTPLTEAKTVELAKSDSKDNVPF